MKQNNCTELLGYSCLEINIQNDSQMPQIPNSVFPGLSIGNRFFFGPIGSCLMMQQKDATFQGSHGWSHLTSLGPHPCLEPISAQISSRKSRKITDLGGYGGHFHCKSQETFRPKAPQDDSAHFGLGTFRCHFGKNEHS